jgi:hypothetical protein
MSVRCKSCRARPGCGSREPGCNSDCRSQRLASRKFNSRRIAQHIFGGPTVLGKSYTNHFAGARAPVRRTVICFGSNLSNVGSPVSQILDRQNVPRRSSPRAENRISSGMALDLVVAIPGSISFTRADAVTNDVKVIRIDGLLPNDAGYPLK